MRRHSLLLVLWPAFCTAGKELGPARLSASLYKTIMESMPIATVDVMIFSDDLSRVLLFRRRNPPVQGVYYSVGGRVFKNERLRRAALRKLHEETTLTLAASELTLGGVVEEIFDDSMFNASVNSHCINSVFGVALPAQSEDMKHVMGDTQHADAAWFSVRDKSLHPLIRKKVFLLLPKIMERRARSEFQLLEYRDRGAEPAGDRRERRVARKRTVARGKKALGESN